MLQATQRLEQLEPCRFDLARGSGFLQPAARLGFVLAVAKAALPQKRAELDESMRQRVSIKVLQCEFLQAG